MPISLEEVLNISHLARLHIDEEQAGQYVEDLSKILAWVAQMNQVDTEGVVPMAHPLDVVQRLREDRVTETDQREKFQSIAPRTDRGLYLVPRVIE